MQRGGKLAIDRQALDKLRDIVGGDEVDLVELVESFLEEGPGLIEAITLSQCSADLLTMRRAAHSLKSNARDMGAIELSALCAKLEARCAAGERPGTSDVDAANLAFTEAVAELRNLYPVNSR
ncbi:MAG: hypothetical protein JWR51_80 [Devosia sp.]|nr:hypothetical protein [Devosia sp.]